MKLKTYGWNEGLAEAFRPFEGMIPGRVVRERRNACEVVTEDGERLVRCSNRYLEDVGQIPVVGDWVAVRDLTVHGLLPRKSRFSRKVAWNRTEEQTVAANIDTLFLVSGLDLDFNPRRIERYLTLAWNSGADPVIVLNKADLYPDIEPFIAETQLVAPGVPVLAVSAIEGRIEGLENHFAEGRTVALVGSSGVGKSAIINAIIGEERQKTGRVRRDNKGRHTTTVRELVLVPDGGILVDTPGMREVQLWADEEDLTRSFSDIEDLAGTCRFRDCRHQKEPGCAVHLALGEGALDPDRYDSYLQLRRELKHLAEKRQRKARRKKRR